MKALISLAAVIAGLVLLFSSAPTALAKSGWGLEDPQLCVNGQLLTVVPARPAEVFVTVPKGASVDFVVEDCGGDPTYKVVPSNHVFTLGVNMIRVAAFVRDGTAVTFQWGDQTVVDVARFGVANAKFASK